MANFLANHGLAGAVLASQQAELVNDVQNDPRFYRRFDRESGFVTRNMIAIPLTSVRKSECCESSIGLKAIFMRKN
jgi:hypothetical protein